MTIEEGWKMYTDIQSLKDEGLNKSQIARKLKISRPTLDKYYHMDADTYDKTLEGMQKRSKKADKYHDEILNWLVEYPDLSGAQIYDRLEEKYDELDFSEGTLRNYVRAIRKKYNILKEALTRQYEAMEDPPMGRQVQVDFGQKWVFKENGIKIQVYAMCFVFSHSRFKYCEWQARPFNTADIIQIHENAFEYFGGMPEEIVYDQDRLILVSENYGDLIYTHKFSSYIQRRKFKVYMCRGADPESKGRVEKVVDFVKSNFAHNRVFYNLDKWNEETLSWLDRRGNGKEHGTTKKIPAEAFLEERKYLRPVTEKLLTNSTGISITYRVRKDNTVAIRGNRYSVPIGTYQGPYTNVRVNKIDDEYIIITHLENDEELARHKIPSGKGQLLKNNNHTRDRSKRIVNLIKQVSMIFPDSLAAEAFFEGIRVDKPRYIRDQLLVIKGAIEKQDSKIVGKALDFCIKNRLYSAIDFRDAMAHYGKGQHRQTVLEEALKVAPLSPDSLEQIKAQPQVRAIKEYSDIFKKQE
ncbi:MAG TPA: IS21 family transposase [Thermoclostridium sp.]|nr:IS21 family transposase [Thermoclostridium sp.]